MSLDISLILGCPFLATLNAKINCRSEKMSITCNGEDIVLNIFVLDDEMQENINEDSTFSIEGLF
jgi:hypothetical protein